MKIKPGMFVRTKYRNEVVIRQIKNIFETSEHDHQLVFDKPTKYQYYVEDNNFIAKERLIDLTEVGDYVNGEKVILVQRYSKHNIGKQGTHLIQTHSYDINDDNQYLIETIVTKEQFERECYRLGDDKQS